MPPVEFAGSFDLTSPPELLSLVLQFPYALLDQKVHQEMIGHHSSSLAALVCQSGDSSAILSYSSWTERASAKRLIHT
jgi:hypothetical protein